VGTKRGYPDPFGYLKLPVANQKENHFSWALYTVLNCSNHFAKELLKEAEFADDSSRIGELAASFQDRLTEGIIDLTLCYADSARPRSHKTAIWVEVKVDAQPSESQLRRYKEIVRAKYSRSGGILIATSEPNFRPPSDVHYLTWGDVWRLLKEAEDFEKERAAKLLLGSFRKVLEEDNMVDFQGFDQEILRKYISIMSKDKRVIMQARRTALTLADAIRASLADKMGDEKPFHKFRSKPNRERPKEPGLADFVSLEQFTGYYYRKKGKNQKLWVGFYIDMLSLDIAVGFGTWGTGWSEYFLSALLRKKSLVSKLRKKGYTISWRKGRYQGEEHRASSFQIEQALQAQPYAVNVFRLLPASGHEETYATKKIIVLVTDILEEACGFASRF